MLAPESLGLPLDIHERIFEREKQDFGEGKDIVPADFPEVLDVINSPGVVGACNKLVGENWAIVPFTHNAPFPSGPGDQHWHKDDNGPYNSRKQRHHQAVQIEMLYYPQAVGEDMGPTAMIPYSHYWTFNHEENHDNFAGADHLDFDYHISGMERERASGPDSKYDADDIIHRRTAHDIRMRDAVTNTGWPLVQQFEAAPLRAGSVVLYSHNTFHRRNHRRDDWRTWDENPRFMWRFWIYRTTDSARTNGSAPAEISWNSGVDPLTHIDLTEIDDDVTSVWRYHCHWIQTGQTPPPRPEAAALSSQERQREADHLYTQLHLKGAGSGAGERRGSGAGPHRSCLQARIHSATRRRLSVFWVAPLYTERESVRRAATYGLIAVGPDATSTFLEATNSQMKWVRKAGVYGLGDASPLNDEVLQAAAARLREDASVYVRSVAAGTLGCLGRRAVATGVGQSLIPACLEAPVQCLAREENRLSMERAQQRSLKFSRPTDEADERAVPGHWEGDLILGLDSSAIGTLVDRSTRFTILMHLPRMDGHGDLPRTKNGPAFAGHGAEAVRDAITASISTLPEQLRRSLTWDQGAEMAQHAQLRIDTDLAIYFCDPHSPWQRGTNENTNGLLRQYFPKGTDLSRHNAEDLAAVATALNSRPRKTLGWRTPAEMLSDHIHSVQQATVATTP